MFTGGPAPSLSGDAFATYTQNIRAGGARGQVPNRGNIGDVVGDARAGAIDEKQRQYEEQKLDKMFMQGVWQQDQINGRTGEEVPATNRHQQTGYPDLVNPGLMGKATILPFDEQYEKSRNYQGIINSYDPRLFAATEQIVRQVEQLGPRAEQVLAYKGSLYAGIPSDFAVNRLYILNTRNREESMYSFV